MELLGWLLAAVFAVLALTFWRQSRSASTSASARTSTPAATSSAAGSGMDPWQDDVQDVTLQAAAGFLSRTVSQDLKVLRQGIGPDSPLMDALDQALQAVDDFSFYAASPPEESWTEENLASVVQEAVRDYTKETRVPVRVHPPAEAVTVRVRRQALQDAVFMVLTNAGLFSGGRPIDVHMEAHPPRGFAIHIRDGGPGFTPEALERAVEPFWSTDSRGLGLGLPYVRRRVALLKGDLSLRNRPDGGGEVSLSFPEGGAPSAQ